ncbi:hypothetical protein KCTC32516_02027 [Polaribacter huanghezhanensis]|uniref:hypothetical protein n=1 Tax=Polaribacter huanghezhanensis TaxID=1354726 RepID=UPI0026497AAD|nr:hypothetical protein [Polaribacter huanghezhanensis]WKD86651.1 hypothetical protein KCTC32516_02027 [Polaribacter huanghezhanensis]
MKKVSIVMLVFVMALSQACTEKVSKKEIVKETISEKKESAKITESDVIFENLDQALSPFEDLTEFALAKNDKGIQKSLSKIDNTAKNNVFTDHLKPESIMVLNEKIAALKKYFKKRDYAKTALTSTEIFNYNVSNFKDASKIENQIKIEHLDYLGFKILALIDQKKIDWKNIEHTTKNVEQVWKSLSTEVKDSNLKASFNLLFDGIHLSVKEKNKKMAAIFANMVLDLVDVLENTF